MPDIASTTFWSSNFAVIVAAIVLVVLAASVHYEGLNWINRRMIGVGHPPRRVVLYAVLALIALHIVEIWIFGLGYHFLLLWPEVGYITGTVDGNLLDHIYFSATVYSTVGFGDLSPVGPIRFLAATESLVGLVLIGWSVSFTYLEMEQHWRRNGPRG